MCGVHGFCAARPRAFSEFDIETQTLVGGFTGAVGKYAAKHFQNIFYRNCIGERAYCLSGRSERFGLVGENDSRKIFASHYDKKVIFVVAHEDIVFGTECFYEVRFFYERLYFGFGLLYGKSRGLPQEPFRTRLSRRFFSEIKGEARFEISSFADVKNAAEAVAENIYAG